jgi:hypothetical protein
MDSRFRLMVAVGLLAGCDPGESDDEGGKGSLTANTDTGTPHKNAPEIKSLTCSTGDPYTLEDGSVLPTIVFTVDYEDDDGDAHVLSAAFWHDETVDGVVDTSGAATAEWGETAMKNGAGEIEEEGEGFTGTITLIVTVSGGNLAFETLYEYAVIIYDSVKTPSAPDYCSGTTPAYDSINDGGDDSGE